MSFGEPSFSLIVPFRDEPRGSTRGKGSSRQDIWEWLRRRWAVHFPDARSITIGAVEDRPWTRSAARNYGAALAACDTLVFADADVIVPRSQLQAAVNLVKAGTCQWVIAFEHYHQLTAEDTEHILDQDPTTEFTPLAEPRWSTDQGNAGMLVMSRDAFDRVRGYDERFIEWGWEDWAIANALSTLVHPQVRVPGAVLHLCHPRSRNRTKRQGRALFDRYDRAMGDCEAMDHIIHEEDRPWRGL